MQKQQVLKRLAEKVNRIHALVRQCTASDDLDTLNNLAIMLEQVLDEAEAWASENALK